jgi:predicted nucleic acid-binding protein
MKTTRQCLLLGTGRTHPIFASLRGLCGFAVNSSHPFAGGILAATLDAGESEAIAMSLAWPADLLIMDESSGRAMARNLNIRITGTLGVLLKAKRDGQIPSLKSEMDRLVQDAGFFVSDRVRNTFLAEAGEAP